MRIHKFGTQSRIQRSKIRERLSVAWINIKMESQGLQDLPPGLLSFAVNSCQDVTRDESMTIGDLATLDTADLRI